MNLLDNASSDGTTTTDYNSEYSSYYSEEFTTDLAEDDLDTIVTLPVYIIILLVVMPALILPLLTIAGICFYRRCYVLKKMKR